MSISLYTPFLFTHSAPVQFLHKPLLSLIDNVGIAFAKQETSSNYTTHRCTLYCTLFYTLLTFFIFTYILTAGDSAIFEVALAEPPDSLVWLKDNKPLNGDGSLTGRILSTASENKREHRLQIRQVDHADAGLYTAVASNSKGKTTCSAQLIVHER